LSSTKTLYVFLIASFCPGLLPGQNLIPNGDFESFEQCPTDEGHFEGYATDWVTFFGTPNYMNCDYFGQNPAILPAPHSGTGLSSCVWFDSDPTPPNVTREYLAYPLEAPLRPERYYGAFWIYTLPFQVITQNYQLLLTNSAGLVFDDDILLAVPDLSNTEFLPTGQWVKIGGCFEADGDEDMLVLGNFTPDEATVYLDTVIGFTDFHFIDDVSLYRVASLVPADTILLAGQSYFFDTTAYRSYELEGSLVSGGSRVFEVPGFYEAVVFLDECGQIGTFTIEVQDCSGVVSLFDDSALVSTDYCAGDRLSVVLPVAEEVEYYIGQQLVAGTLTLDTLGESYVYAVHAYCGILDSAVYNGLDCSQVERGSCYYVPNAFSPNGDGANDRFLVQGQCQVQSFHLEIFDRWGSQVFISNNINNSWDGVCRGEPCVGGVYTYFLSITFRDGLAAFQQTESGEVHLVR